MKKSDLVFLMGTVFMILGFAAQTNTPPFHDEFFFLGYFFGIGFIIYSYQIALVGD